MILKVEAANSAVCYAQSTHLVSHRVWQHPSVLLDPAGALVNVVCPPTCAHMQMLTARGQQEAPWALQEPVNHFSCLQRRGAGWAVTQTQISKALPRLYAVPTGVYAIIIFIPTIPQRSQGNIYMKRPLNKWKKPFRIRQLLCWLLSSMSASHKC